MLNRIKGWPLWAKIATPFVILLLIGGIASASEPEADAKPATTSTAAKPTSTTDAPTTLAPITTVAPTTTAPATVPPSTAAPPTVPPATQAPPPPAPVAAAPPATEPPAPPSDVYFENCDAARAAGAAPLLSGAPGYRAGLDRDGDGVVCES